MAEGRRGVGFIVLVLLIGLIVGSFLGELFGALLPSGFWKTLLTAGPTVGLTRPATLDLDFLSFTLGLTLKVNLLAVVGVVLAAIALRKL